MEISNIPLLPMSDRQDLYSMAYVYAVAATAGFNYSELKLDRNSADVYIHHYKPGEFDPQYELLSVQVKCSYAHGVNTDNSIHYPLPIKNYNDLRIVNSHPRILVLVHIPRPDDPNPQAWVEYGEQHTVLRYHAYWVSIMGAEPVNSSTTVTVRVPVSNRFDVETLRFLMDHMVARGNKKL